MWRPLEGLDSAVPSSIPQAGQDNGDGRVTAEDELVLVFDEGTRLTVSPNDSYEKLGAIRPSRTHPRLPTRRRRSPNRWRPPAPLTRTGRDRRSGLANNMGATPPPGLRPGKAPTVGNIPSKLASARLDTSSCQYEPPTGRTTPRRSDDTRTDTPTGRRPDRTITPSQRQPTRLSVSQEPSSSSTSPTTQAPFTMHAAAERLRVSHRMIRRLVNERRIGFVRVGKFIRLRQCDIDTYIEQNFQPPLNSASHI